ncbi:MAG TPA: Crp/Fnr family transcriptional regulator, partial [Burkholderiaceae bacterium]|nr:Crp/Fnr family transcriptional regulator [Burkholderiaceae bacterium]
MRWQTVRDADGAHTAGLSSLSHPLNNLIERLPGRDRAALLDIAKPVPLDIGAAMYTAGEPTRHVYFPTDGFISLVTATGDEPGLEVGMVGSEGMLGAQLALGVSISPLRAMVQGQGSALRVDAAPFRRRLATSTALRSELNRYLYVLMAQLATSAACTRFHGVGPRLARWLLMSHDRAHADTFRLTHEFLAFMLGVRRVGITRAATELQQRGL